MPGQEVVTMAEPDEINYIKRFQEQIAGLNAVDRAAQEQRKSIEKELDRDPYFDHLYTEQAYDHLSFLELRRIESKLDILIGLLSGTPVQELTALEPIAVPAPVIDVDSVATDASGEETEVVANPTKEAQDESEDVLEDTPESASLTPAERASIRRSSPRRRG